MKALHTHATMIITREAISIGLALSPNLGLTILRAKDLDDPKLGIQSYSQRDRGEGQEDSADRD